MFLDQLLEKAEKNGIVDSKHRPILKYSLEILSLQLVFLSLSVFLGFITGMINEVIFFLSLFIPLRMCAGGFHLKSRIGCMIMSLFAVGLLLVGLKTLEVSSAILLPMIIICVVLVSKLAPQDCNNKRLYSYQKQRLKIIVGFIGLIYLLLAIFLKLLGANKYLLIEYYSLMMTLILLYEQLKRNRY